MKSVHAAPMKKRWAHHGGMVKGVREFTVDERWGHVDIGGKAPGSCRKGEYGLG